MLVEVIKPFAGNVDEAARYGARHSGVIPDKRFDENWRVIGPNIIDLPPDRVKELELTGNVKPYNEPEESAPSADSPKMKNTSAPDKK